MQQGCFLIFVDIFIISIPKSQHCLDCLVCELVLTLRLMNARKIMLQRNLYQTSFTNDEKIKWLRHSKISLLTRKVILQRFFFSNSIYSLGHFYLQMWQQEVLSLQWQLWNTQRELQWWVQPFFSFLRCCGWRFV